MSVGRSARDAQRLSDEGPASWFGPDAEVGGFETADTAASAPALEAPDSSLNAESAFFFRGFRRAVRPGVTAFARLYRTFLAARVALALVLTLALLLASLLGPRNMQLPVSICVAYALVAATTWWMARDRYRVEAEQLARLDSPQWWLTIGLDLGVFALLNAIDLGGMGYSALFILPVMMAGVLTPRLVALATAAMAALVLLGLAGWQVWVGTDNGVHITQAGLVGSGFFVVSLLTSEMASRIAGEEQAARGSMELARQQAQLNRLVLDEMQDGVLVVDRRGLVRAANPAARQLMGEAQWSSATPFQLRGVQPWRQVVQAVDRAFVEGGWPEAGRDVLIQFAGGVQRSLRVRVRFTRQHESSAEQDLCVLLLEDNRQVLARTRQEKLAAMGRVSAGIAHEIRNPLAAIDQANALLSEDLSDPRALQLTRMVASNVQRLKRLVEDVMDVAPGVLPEPMPLDASSLVQDICLEWARTNHLPEGAGGPLRCEVPTHSVMVSFEPEHLRRVLVNLLDNALRHAPQGLDTVRVRLEEYTLALAQLTVFSAGAPIPVDVERHLFEPFFSTRSRGSGLGLFICRELCERYGGRIEYHAVRQPDSLANHAVHGPGPAHAGNEFRVLLKRVTAPASPNNDLFGSDP
ncbi:MAG: PAS domain-containing protein [Burkholderiaceae bacterium]|nr:PAS domain-containing protein [Burkholderiaceae bacterium]